MILLDTKKYSVNQSIDKKKIYTLQDKGNNSKERQLIYNTSKWHKLRQYKLASNPICEICNGQYQTEIHHKDSFMNYVGALRYYMAFENFNNLQSLCRECHQHEHKKKKIHDEDDIF